MEYIFSIDLPCVCVFVGRCYKFVYNANACEVRSASSVKCSFWTLILCLAMLVGGHGESNPNTTWLQSRGLWISYALGMLTLHLILLSVPILSVPFAWTLTNLIHNTVCIGPEWSCRITHCLSCVNNKHAHDFNNGSRNTLQTLSPFFSNHITEFEKFLLMVEVYSTNVQSLFFFKHL